MREGKSQLKSLYRCIFTWSRLSTVKTLKLADDVSSPVIVLDRRFLIVYFLPKFGLQAAGLIEVGRPASGISL